MVTPCRAKIETQVSQESHELVERDVLVGCSSENLDEQFRSRRHVENDIMPTAYRINSARPDIEAALGYSSEAVRLISRNGGPNHLRM